MKKILLSLLLMFSGTLIAHCGITVGVTMQLLENERNKIPDKTIEENFKQLRYSDKCPLQLRQQLDSLMAVTADNAIMWRTYSLKIEPAVNDTYNVTILQCDPTVASESYMGPIIVQHCHFMVEVTTDNKNLVNTLFDRHGEKVKYIREFEVVYEKDDTRFTSIEAHLSPTSMQITKCMVEGIDLNEDTPDGE